MIDTRLDQPRLDLAVPQLEVGEQQPGGGVARIAQARRPIEPQGARGIALELGDGAFQHERLRLERGRGDDLAQPRPLIGVERAIGLGRQRRVDQQPLGRHRRMGRP